MSDDREDKTSNGNFQPEDAVNDEESPSATGNSSDSARDEVVVEDVQPPAPWAVSNNQAELFFQGGDYADIHREDSLGNHWSVPWADLMMSMFVLFAALVTAQALERKVPEFIDRIKETVVEKEVPSSEPNFEALTRINVFDRSQQAVQDANIDNVEIVLMADQSVKVSVQGPMFFDAGKDVLRPDVEEFLNTLARVIRQTSFKVNVIGHTDDTPISNRQFASNWELSLMRATQVTKHLIQSGGIDPARFTIMGRSQYEPVTFNTDDMSRSQNRRVEIIITRDVTASAED